MKITIVVITYQRPQMLERLLDSLSGAGGSFVLVVVDNDVAGSAHHVASRYDCRYVIESTPGIAAARNRGLTEVGDDADAVVFVDDDEWVTSGWLTRLFEVADEFDADAVFGPVVPLLPESSPRWIRSGGFFDRPRQRTGETPRWPATGNVLIRTSALSLLGGVHFSEDFSLTGGSDTELFHRLAAAGACLVWCEDAIVVEDVPVSRASARWLWRRGVRLGNVSGRMMGIRGRGRLQIIAIAGARILAALPLAAYAVLRRRPWGSALLNIPKGVGMFNVARGRLTVEYGRVK